MGQFILILSDYRACLFGIIIGLAATLCYVKQELTSLEQTRSGK